MRSAIWLAAAIATSPVAAQQSGYAGQAARDIKALSAEDVGDLLAGRGMRMALPGELNHYPGPAHVLELRDQLALEAHQLRRVQRIFERMSVAARPLGAAIVERERALDRGFAERSIGAKALTAETAAIARFYGGLRNVHLAAHLETAAVLTQRQIAEYDRLRGYAGQGPVAPQHQHRHGG